MSRKAHDPIELPEWWFHKIERWRAERHISLAELGRLVGDALGEQPFSDATMSRFMRGRATRQVADGVALVTGLPVPETGVEEPYAKWLDLGRRLGALDMRLLLDEMHDLELAVTALERAHARRGRQK